MSKRKATRIMSVRFNGEKMVPIPEELFYWAQLNMDVINWFKESKDVINLRAICIEAGLNTGNTHIDIYRNGQLSEENLGKLVPVISKYGFTQTKNK